jgi:hypothetical protein
MRAIIVKNEKLEQVKWDNKDILKRISQKERLEIAEMNEVINKREENYYHQHRMDLMCK